MDMKVPPPTSADLQNDLDIEDEVRRYTYQDLIEHFDANEAHQFGEQQAKNRRSALTQFLDYLDKGRFKSIGAEFSDDQFPIVLAAWDEAAAESGVSEGSRRNRKTYLRAWCKSYKAMMQLDGAEKFDRVCDALKYYLEKAGCTGPAIENVSSKVGLKKSYLRSVVLNQRTTLRHQFLPNITRLEEELGVPVSSLTRFVSKDARGITERKLSKIGSTAFGKKTSSNIAKPYRLGFVDFPDGLRQEIRSFIQFKTVKSVIPLVRNENWRLKPKSEFSNSEDAFQFISLDGKRFSVSALKFASALRSFFGAMEKLGYPRDKFSIAWLTDFSLVREYADFMEKRMGYLTAAVEEIVTHSKSLLLRMERYGRMQNFGFIRQKPEFGARLLTPVAPAQWDAWCTEQASLFAQFLGELKSGGHIKAFRDPSDPLRDILARVHPITALFELIENMRSYFERQRMFMKPKDRIAFQRDLLLIRMMTVQPLRIRMYGIMEYHEDNSGNLYKRADGAWAIKFDKEDFKNEKGAAKDKNYDVPLPAELWPDIEHFLKNVRPDFNNPLPNFFVAGDMGSEQQKRKRSEGRGDIPALAKAFESRSRQFLEDCPGFNPHAVRHIVATDYIKNNPSGYQIAADVLHDRLVTVIKAYAHLQAADGHKFYQAWLNGISEEWKKGA
jgi:hypothetical protein